MVALKLKKIPPTDLLVKPMGFYCKVYPCTVKPLFQATLAMEVDEAGPSETTESLYVFEGTDYSKEPSADDKKAFDALVTGKSKT